jgi:hypothetical protein
MLHITPYTLCRNTKMPRFPHILNYIGFEVFTVVVMNSTIFWDITPCSLLSVNWRFGGTYRLHLQGERNKFSKKPARSTDYTALYPRRWYSSYPKLIWVIVHAEWVMWMEEWAPDMKDSCKFIEWEVPLSHNWKKRKSELSNKIAHCPILVTLFVLL